MLAFVHIPKTAGTTITQVLRQSFGARHCDIRLWPHDPHLKRMVSADDIRRLSYVYWRLESIAGHNVAPYTDLHRGFPNLQFYTFCREPLVRLASHYQMLVHKAPMADNFFEWIKKGTDSNGQTQFLAGYQDAEAAIEMLENAVGFVGLTERFNESLVMFRRWSEYLNVDIRYFAHNVAADNSIKRRLLTDPASLAALIDANREDLKLYDYIVREVYPRQQKAYGPTLASDVAEFEQCNKRRFKPATIPGSLVRNLLYKPFMPLTTRGQVFSHPSGPVRRTA